MDDRDWSVTLTGNGDFTVNYVQTDIPEEELTYYSFIEVDGEFYDERRIRLIVAMNKYLTSELEQANDDWGAEHQKATIAIEKQKSTQSYVHELRDAIARLESNTYTGSKIKNLTEALAEIESIAKDAI